MSARDILFEIGMEEIPAGFIAPALEYMQQTMEKWLTQNRIDFASLETCATPRRLTIIARHVAATGANIEQELLGPAQSVAYDASGALTKAGEGFLRGKGLQPSDAYLKETPKGTYLAAMKREQGLDTATALPEFFTQLVLNFPFKKSMRWGTRKIRFARPIKHFILLRGNDVLPMNIEGIVSGRTTFGHRFLGASSIEITSAADYAAQLEKEYVIVDIARRQEMIRQGCAAIAAQMNGTVVGGESLTALTANLVEYPVAVMGSFEEKFRELPDELLITSMREHQKYFALQGADGTLLPAFITISNMPIDDTSAIRQGNERVLRARLSDAFFYYAEDQKAPLASRLAALEKVVFQEQLGTVGEKVSRIRGNGYAIGKLAGLNDEQLADVDQIALLAKCDLTTGMVYEFPELQGIMGREYARKEGYKPVVAAGVNEHWAPRFAGDNVASSLEAAVVSMADKLDTIVGCFGVGLLPSGSYDPYALRRQSLGVLHTLAHHEIDVPLGDLIRVALDNLTTKLTRNTEIVFDDVLNFTTQRARVFFEKNVGFDYDVVDAVFSTGFSSVITVRHKLDALSHLKSRDDYRSVIETFRRAGNIVPADFSAAIDTTLCLLDVEKALLAAVQSAAPNVHAACQSGKYDEVFAVVLQLKPTVDAFFDGVMVMDKDEALKRNRLALLSSVMALFSEVADFRKLVIE